MTTRPPAGMQWLTTAPNPRTPATGHDAGQRGWKLHLVRAGLDQPLASVRFARALCGLVPAHGWGVDLFIGEECKRCLARAASLLDTQAEGRT